MIVRVDLWVFSGQKDFWLFAKTAYMRDAVVEPENSYEWFEEQADIYIRDFMPAVTWVHVGVHARVCICLCDTN